MKVKVKVAQSCLSLWDPMGYTVYGILRVRILKWVAFPFSRRSSQSRFWTQISRFAGGFFTTEPQGKPKNTGVGSLSLCQRIFLTQELNWGLLHCRRILCHLSYQGSTKGLLKHCSILCSPWDLLANIFIINLILESRAWFRFAVKTEKGVHLIFGFQRLVKWKREGNIYKRALEWLSLHSMLVKEAIALVKIPSTWP